MQARFASCKKTTSFTSFLQKKKQEINTQNGLDFIFSKPNQTFLFVKSKPHPMVVMSQNKPMCSNMSFIKSSRAPARF